MPLTSSATLDRLPVDFLIPVAGIPKLNPHRAVVRIEVRSACRHFCTVPDTINVGC